MKILAASIAILSVLIGSPHSADELPVQSLLLRAVITTCKLDESIAFYRDILAQRVIQERDFTPDVINRYTTASDTGTVRVVMMEGRANTLADRSSVGALPSWAFWTIPMARLQGYG